MRNISDFNICKAAKCHYLNADFGICRLQRMTIAKVNNNWRKMSKTDLSDLDIPDECPFYLEQLVNEKPTKHK